jgi:putative DNA methylase
MPNNDRRLIEDLIPIREISAEASREKSLRHGNISTLHLWWARRPIVAARAAVYGALVPAPSDAKERETYMARMRKLCSATLEGLGFDPEVGSRRGNTICLHCGATVNSDYVKQEGSAGRMKQQLIAIVAIKQESKGKTYIDTNDLRSWIPSEEFIRKHLVELCQREHLTLPEEDLPKEDSKNFWVVEYGLSLFVNLFTPRQLLALLTFVAEVHHAHAAMLEEGLDFERTTAITTYLGLGVDRLADYNSTLCNWHNTGEKIGHTYARQTLPMAWDFTEVNPFGGATGNITGALTWILEALQTLVDSGHSAYVSRTSATKLLLEDAILDAVITDPPYYDNVSYADLSDFFYIWLKRSIGFLYPEHFSTHLTPKKQEAVMAAYRHNKNKETARQSYETMMAQAFSESCRVLKPGAPLVCVYAHKTTLGWSTLIEALRHAGFVITEAWPLDTEMKERSVARGTAALASSIFLVARRRENQETGDYVGQVRPQLISIITERLDTLIGAGLTGADLIIATIGAGLRAYTQFAKVEMPNGDELDAKTFLGEVEREVALHVLQRLLEVVEGEDHQDAGARVAAVDTVTRFYVTGRFFYDESAAPFDDMNLLARGMGVELDGPRGLAQGKKGLVKKEKDTVVLRDYRARGDDEHLGRLSESGNSAPLIDVLQRLLWLLDEQPYEVQDFLMRAHPPVEQLRMVAQALAGHALAPAGSNGTTKQDRSEEQKAVDRLLAGWRGLFSEVAGRTLWD